MRAWSLITARRQPLADQSIRPTVRSLLPWLILGGIIRLSLAPFTSHPYDMGAWITHQLAPFDAGLDPFFNWKYGAPVLAILLLAHLPALATVTLLGVPQILAQQFWVKFPFILADVGLAIVLGRCVWYVTHRRADAKLATVVWLLNPVAIFFTAVHGQVDALASVLILLAVLSLLTGSESRGVAFALAAGTAKYVGFVLVPFTALRSLVGTGPRWATLGKIAGACVVVVVVAFGPGFILGGLLGGLKSSLVSGAKLSPWSIWSLVGNVNGASQAWAIVFVGWCALLLWLIARSPDRTTLSVIRGVTSALAMLVALHPFANPQFIIWLMPLALFWAFVDRSSLRLAFVAIIGLLNLITLFALVEPIAWFLNAVPNVYTVIFDAHYLTGSYDPEVARLTGAGYALALVMMASADAAQIALARRNNYLRSRAWEWIGRLTVAAGGGIALFLMLTVFQPALVHRYADAPRYPLDLDRLNSFPATRTEWDHGNPGTLRLQWSDAVRNYAEGHLRRGTVEVSGRTALSAVVSRTEVASVVSVEDGVAERVTLPYVGRLMRVNLLLGNPSFGVQASPPLPIIRLSSVSDPLRRIEVAVSAEHAVFPGWFIVSVEPRDAITDRAFTLEVFAPPGAGWSWNGAGEDDGNNAISVLRPANDIGDRWTQVWAVPLDFALEAEGLRLTDDYHLAQALPLGDLSTLSGVSIEVSRPLLGSRPLASLKLDVRQGGGLQPLHVAGIGVASLAYLAFFALLTVRITRFRADDRVSEDATST